MKMKEICYYEADDGTKFDNEGECRRYEIFVALKSNEKDFSVYYYDQTKINFCVDDAEKLETPDNVFYIKVDTESAVCALIEWFDFFGVRHPFEYRYPERCIGHWIYDENRRYEDCWVKIEEVHDRIHNILDNFG
jgi:hypothetical protein